MSFSVNVTYNTNCVAGLELSSANIIDTDIEKDLTGASPLVNEYSMDLDGANEYMFANNSPELSFTDNTTDSGFTISVWLYKTITSNAIIVNKRGDNTAPLGREYQLAITGNKAVFIIFDGDSFGSVGFLRADTVVDTPFVMWFKLVATYDGSGTYAGLSIYINEVLQTTVNASVAPYNGMKITPSDLVLGKAGWVDVNYYKGGIEEFSMFKDHFNQTEVSEVYNGGLPTNLNQHSKAANLIIWSRMGDNDTWAGVNWTLNDNSTNSNTITTVNMEEIDRVTNVPT